MWVVADEQVGGRGRRGRTWHSPPGNLYASLLLPDPCPVELAPQLGFVAGVALREATAALAPAAGLQLKWPNDLLSTKGAKLAGILLEASRLPDGRFACVVGIGVNCRSHPADLPYAATDLSILAEADVTPECLFTPLDRSMVEWIDRWEAGANFAAVRKAWLEAAAGLGGEVSVALGDKTVHGTFETIDAAGRMVVRTLVGEMTVDAGDVRLGTRVMVSA